MTTLLADFAPVASLQAGQTVRYYGSDYVVAEVRRCAAPLSGHAVFAYAGGNLDEGAVLIYAVEGALAELSGSEL